MQMYVSEPLRPPRKNDDLPTVEILHRDPKNAAAVNHVAHDANVYASKYQLYLASKPNSPRPTRRAPAGTSKTTKVSESGE